MKRYRLARREFGGWDLNPHKDGEVIYYDDHAAEVARIREGNEAQQEYMRQLEEGRDEQDEAIGDLMAEADMLRGEIAKLREIIRGIVEGE